jgi:tetratricopeptide (TPR) repeat protein
MKHYQKTLIPLFLCVLGLLMLFSNTASQQTANELFEKALFIEEAQGDLQKAIGLYLDIIKRFPENREVAAMAQLHLGLCYEKLGLKQAREAFQKVIDNYPDQGDAVKAAREKLILLTRTQGTLEKGDKDFRTRRVYDGIGLEWGNGLSSDGRYLVYTDWNTGDLAVVDLMTIQSRNLTNKEPAAKSQEMGECSAFSPNDKQVAYGWYNQNQIPELRVIDFDGRNPRVLYRNEESAWIRPHEWTPDGKQILVVVMRKDGTSQIALVSATDGAIRILRDVKSLDPGLDLSPDGRYVACSMPSEPTSSKRDVFIIKVNGVGGKQKGAKKGRNGVGRKATSPEPSVFFLL